MKSLWTFALLFLVLNVHSQDQKQQSVPASPLNNAQRFLVDYEVKNWNQAIQDTAKLNSVNLDDFETMRKWNDDTEIQDNKSGLVIILYSVVKTANNKKD